MKRRNLALAILLIGAVPAVATAQVGSVLRAQKINETTGGFTGLLHDDDHFGWSMAALGDLDGDGVSDLAVSAPEDDDGGVDRGAIWILFLNASGSVHGQSKISQTQGGFTGVLSDSAGLGWRIAAVGDLDGDGVTELAATAISPNRLWVLFLKPDGTVKSQMEILFSDPAFQPATTARTFLAGDLIGLGDLDGDGLGDVAIGAPLDAGAGSETGALWILRLKADGSLKAALKIGPNQGGFTGVLEPGNNFGSSLVQLGDLDGDGNRELGVRASLNNSLGQFWILHLDANELVLSQSEFEYGDFGMTFAGSGTTLGVPHVFAWLGDLDGDGVGELALGYSDFPGGERNQGGIAIAFLRNDGTLRKRMRIGDDRGGMGNLPRDEYLGSSSLVPLGDLDGDGSLELAAGAFYDRVAGGEHHGALWILSLDPDVPRNGSGSNPLTLSETSEPVFGSIWSPTLDCSGHASDLAFLWGYDQPASGSFLPGGEILIGGRRLFRLLAVHPAGPTPFPIGVPPVDLSLIDLPVFVQGLCAGAPGPRLSNALDVLIGQ